jgi:hypothetical protein
VSWGGGGLELTLLGKRKNIRVGVRGWVSWGGGGLELTLLGERKNIGVGVRGWVSWGGGGLELTLLGRTQYRAANVSPGNRVSTRPHPAPRLPLPLLSHHFQFLVSKKPTPESHPPHHPYPFSPRQFLPSIMRINGRDHIYGVRQFIEGTSLQRSLENPACFSAKGRRHMCSTAHNPPQ